MLQDRCGRCVWECILVQASGRSWLLGTVISTGRGATQSSPVLCRGLRAGRPVCPGASGRLHCVCGKYVQGSRQVCAGPEGQLLVLLPWLTQETPPVSWLCEGGRPARHKWLYCSEGLCSTETQILPASLRRSRHPERHRSNTYRGILEALPWQDAVSL